MPKIFSNDVVGWESNHSWANPLRLTIDASQLLPYEIGAVLLAYWAFPKPDEETKRKLAAVALCKKSFEQKYVKSPERATRPTLIKPVHALFPEKDALTALRTYNRRARDRIYAMQISCGLSHNPLYTTQSKSKLFEAWAEAKELHVDPANVSSRIWNPSLSVSHITFALFEMARLFPDSRISTFYIGHSYSEIVLFFLLLSKGAERLTSGSHQFRSLTSIKLINLKRTVDWIPDLWELDGVSEMIKRFG